MYFHPLHHFFHHRHREVDEVYFSVSIRSFAISLIAIFIPIYLYTYGYSIQSLMVFYILHYFFAMITKYVGGRLVSVYGSKHILALSYPLIALSFVFFATLPTFDWPLWVLALSIAIPMSLYWISYHMDFSKVKDKGKVGSEIGMALIIGGISGALGPFIGGTLSKAYGFGLPIYLATFLLLFAMIPLLKGREFTKKRPVNMKQFSIKRNIRGIIAYGGFGLESGAMNIFWPLMLFLIIPDYAKVGAIATVGLFAMIGFSFLVGKLADKYDNERMLKTAGIVDVVSSSSRILVATSTTAYVLGVITSVTHIFLHIPFFKEYYQLADEEPRIEFIIGMEMATDLIRLVSLVLVLISTYFLETREVLAFGFALGALGALLTALLGEKKREQAVIAND